VRQLSPSIWKSFHLPSSLPGTPDGSSGSIAKTTAPQSKAPRPNIVRMLRRANARALEPSGRICAASLPKDAVETGALRAGDQLPAISKVAGELVINPNTVARAYRELEPEGILRAVHSLVRDAIEWLASLNLTDDELRRVLNDELAKTRTAPPAERFPRKSMTDFIIETNQLTKSFKGQPALRGLDLRVPPGSALFSSVAGGREDQGPPTAQSVATQYASVLRRRYALVTFAANDCVVDATPGNADGS
jgi:hypothetical protein